MSRGIPFLPMMTHRGSLKVLSALAHGDDVTVIDKGGGMACVVSLGVYEAIANAISGHFKGALLASGGACNFSGFETNRQNVGAAMNVYRHIALGRFIKWKWGPLGPYLIFDREELIEALKGNRAHLGLPAIDEEKIKKSPTKINIVVTNHETGEGVLRDARDGSLFDLLKQTTSIPAVCDPVKSDKGLMSDGAVGMSKLSQIMEMRARYVLIIMSTPPPDWFWEWYMPIDAVRTEMYLALWHRALTPEMRKSIAWMDTNYLKEIKRLMDSPHLEVLVIHPTITIPPWCANLPLLEMMHIQSRDYVENLLEKARV